jgi:hypothetical protein
MDVDLVILAESRSMEMAVSVVKALGLQAGIIRRADFAGGPLFAIRKRNTEPCMIVGRPEGEAGKEGVDILLPSIPWAKDAVERAQSNCVDFGFGPVPSLTLEDVILSKLYSLMGAQLRAKDLDDLQSVFAAVKDVDWAYLAGQMQRFKIVIPRGADPFLPERVLQLSRDVKRAGKRRL